MPVLVEKKFAIDVVYNGLTKSQQVQSEEPVQAVLQKAIAEFHVTQNAHLLSLFRQNGTVVPDGQSVEQAGIKPGEILLLRPDAVRGGGLLQLAADLLTCTFTTLRECGRRECECAVYWTGPVGAALVDGYEHPIHTRSRFGYEIDNDWLTDFWNRLATARRSIKVQVHTHPGEAFHSKTDDEWPIVSQPGFISIVIPNFAIGPASLKAAWIGQLQQDGKWLQLSAADEAMSL